MAERLLTINMRRYLVVQHRSKRIKKAAGYVRDRVAHYTKTDIENVRLSRELNNSIVKHYAKSMEPLKLKIMMDKGTASVDLFKVEQPKPAKAATTAPQEAKGNTKKEKPKAEAKAPAAKQQK